MLSHVIGSSVYAFATMLAAFLTGIALGSAMAGGVSRRPRQALLAFSVCQLGIALASVLVYSRLEVWRPSSATLSLLAFVVILPSTLFIGASWPLAVRAHARGPEDAGTSSAVVYVWNTAGSILGALSAAFVVIPAFGFAGTARLAVLLNIAIGFVAALCLLQVRQYDAIVSQPSHPWTPGASHLFSREFFALAKSRLTEDGVLVQWMNAELVDESLLRSLAATLLSEFRNVRVYQPSALALHFLASDGPLDLEARIGRDGRPILDAMEEFSGNTIHGPTDVMARLLLDEKGVRAFAAGAALITDDDNRMAMDAVVGATGLDLPALTEITAPLDPLLDPTSWLRRELDDTDYAQLVWRLLRDGQVARVTRLLETIRKHSLRQLLQALLHRHEGRFQLGNSLLVSIDPSDVLYEQAHFLLIVERLHEVANGAIELDAFCQFLSPSSRLRTVLRGWRALGQQDWAQLHAMDEALQEVHTNDFWSPQAAQLRAEWRFRARDADGEFAREALRLVDRSIALLPTTDAYVLRARLGLKMGDRPIFIESVAFLIGSVWQRVWALENAGLFLAQGEYNYLHERLSFFLEALAEVDGEDFASERARVVSGRVEEVLAALDAST